MDHYDSKDEFISTIDKIQYLISHKKYLDFTKIATIKSKIENVFFIHRSKGKPEKMPELEEVTSKLVSNNFMENFNGANKKKKRR